jgi:hypothetical protein
MYCTDAYGNIVPCATSASSTYLSAFTNPLFLIVWLGCAGICAFLADRKNRPVGVAVIGGLLTGFIGVLIYALVSTRTAEATPASGVATPAPAVAFSASPVATFPTPVPAVHGRRKPLGQAIRDAKAAQLRERDERHPSA